MATKRRGKKPVKSSKPRRATSATSVQPRGVAVQRSRGRPHDTPVETRAIELVETPRFATGAREATEQALARVRAIETIESAYDAWLELRLHEAQGRRQFTDELRRLDEQGALLVGAVRVAGTIEMPPTRTEGLVTSDLPGFLAQAQAKLVAARRELEAELAEAETSFLAAAAFIRDEIRARVERRAQAVKPRVRLMVRTLPGDRRVLHAQRPEPDDAVTLLFVFSARIPSRYSFLFDDSTDDALKIPPTLYADEGVPAEDTRPSPAQLKSLLEPRPQVWPVKGMVPMRLTSVGGTSTAVRWLERGPVMEAEIEDGEGWRNMLTREEAERITGHLLALKLENRLELELVRG